MQFFSDNAAPVHPAVLAAIARADSVDTAYDGDALSRSLDARLSDLFGAPATALWVTTGTAANALALAALCPPTGAVLCHESAHINVDEGGAPEFYTHGAKLMTLGGDGGKIDPAAIAARIDGLRDDVHQVPARAISITQATESGRVYTPDEVAAIGALARARGLGLHMDGARFANAVARLGCTPGALTVEAGVDALSFGFVKNGGLMAELLVLFRPELAAETRRRLKRGGHLMSKGRYAAASILALLDDDLWLANARVANAAAARIGQAAGTRLASPVEANEVFVRLTAPEAATLRDKGFGFYDWGAGVARFVTAWNADGDAVAALAAAIEAL